MLRKAGLHFRGSIFLRIIKRALFKSFRASTLLFLFILVFNIANPSEIKAQVCPLPTPYWIDPNACTNACNNQGVISMKKEVHYFENVVNICDAFGNGRQFEIWGVLYQVGDIRLGTECPGREVSGSNDACGADFNIVVQPCCAPLGTESDADCLGKAQEQWLALTKCCVLVTGIDPDTGDPIYGNPCLPDNDGDGYYGCPLEACDCDDTNNQIFPGNHETCNNIDDNCSGSIADETSDLDGDTYDPCGTINNLPDPDDTDPSKQPAAEEVSDGADGDGDGEIPAGELDIDGPNGEPDDEPDSAEEDKDACGKSSSPTGSYTGDPIDVTNGSAIVGPVTDLIVKGKGSDIVFTRTYNSSWNNNGQIGLGWSHGFSMYLYTEAWTPDIVDKVIIRDNLAKRVQFNKVGGLYFSKYNISSTLTYDDVNDTYDWTQSDGTVYRFESANTSRYRIATITDIDGNTITITYQVNSDNLAQVTNQSGRIITFVYDSSTNKIDTISSSSQLLADYDYSPDGKLTCVKYGGSGGCSYTYSYGATNNKLEQVTDIDGKVIQSFTYDASTGRATGYFDRNESLLIDYLAEGDFSSQVTFNNTGETRAVTYNADGFATSGCLDQGPGRLVIYDYNNNPVLERDGTGNYVKKEYDQEQRIIAEESGTIIPNSDITQDVFPPSSSGVYNFGDTLDTLRWKRWPTQHFMAGTSAVVSGNSLVISIKDSYSQENVQIDSGAIPPLSSWKLRDNFDLQVKFEINTLPDEQDLSAGEFFILGWSGSAWHFIPIKNVYSVDKRKIQTDFHNGSTWAGAGFVDMPAGQQDNGYFKITRTGSDVNTYFSADGGTWTLVKTFSSFTTNDVFVGFKIWKPHTTSPQTIKGTFSELELNSGTVIGDEWVPSTTPSDRVEYQYNNPLKEFVATDIIYNSLKGGAEKKQVIYDYDVTDDGIPNNASTEKIYRIITSGFTDTNGDGSITDEASATTLITSYEYYPDGQIKSVTDQGGIKTCYDYDSITGDLISVKQNCDGVPELTTTYSNYDVFGNAQTITGPDNVQSQNTYDQLGNLLTQTQDSEGGAYQTTYDYKIDRIDTITFPAGNKMQYQYDDPRTRISAMERQTIAGALLESMSYTYPSDTSRVEELKDAGSFTQKWTEFQRGFDENPCTTGVDSFQYEQTTVGEEAGLQTIRKTYTDPNGNIACVVDAFDSPQEVKTKYIYNSINRLTDVIQNYGGTPEITTSYTYDIASNLASVTDGVSNLTNYTYDDFGRLLQVDSPETSTTTYTYDSAGNLLTKTEGRTDPAFDTTSYTYDPLNRLTTVDYANDAAVDVTYVYDETTPIDPFKPHYGTGRPTTVSELDGSYTKYQYDARGNISVAQTYIANAGTYSRLTPMMTTATCQVSNTRQDTCLLMNPDWMTRTGLDASQ